MALEITLDQNSAMADVRSMKMGRGRIKAKNQLKMQSIRWLQGELNRLQAENKMLKDDPQSVVGKFINEFNEIINQNQRLSSLVCALIAKHGVAAENGGAQRVEVTRDEIEVFRGKRLQVKIETPEGVEKMEDAKSYFFSYEALDPSQVAPAEVHESMVKCTDPNCTLPKDMKHTHTPPTAPGIIVENVTEPEPAPVSDLAPETFIMTDETPTTEAS